MAEPMPTLVGDALILRTTQSFTIYAVGTVSKDGQRDFRSQINVTYVTDRRAAVTAATRLVAPGRRIYLRDIDTDDWSEISR